MASLGTLAVNIVARTEKFTAGITKSIGSIDRLAVGAAKATKVIAGMAAAGAAAGVAITTAYVKANLDAIDTNAKLADQIGITTEAFMRLHYAAGLAGVDGKLLAKSLVTMNRRMAEASLMGGTVAMSFKMLGLNAQQLQMMAPEEAFLKIGDAINKLPTQAQKAKVAFDIFGRGGVSLLSLTQSGSESIRQLGAEADTLGVTFSRAQGAMVEAANDAVSKAMTAAQGMFTQLTVVLAPAIQYVAEEFTKFFSTVGKGFVDNVATGDTFIKRIGIFADLAADLRIIWLYIASGIQGAATAALVLLDIVVKLVEATTGVKTSFGEFTAEMAKFADEMAQVTSKTLNEALVAKMPSEQIAKFYEKVKEQANAAAEATREVTQPKVPSKLQSLGGSLFNAAATAGKFVNDTKKKTQDAVWSDALNRLTFGFAGKALPVAKTAEAAGKAGVNRELTARTAGDIDTYAAARRNLGDNAAKTQIDIAKQSLATEKRIEKQLAKNTPQIFTLAGVT